MSEVISLNRDAPAAPFARIYGVEKHGYTRRVKIPWPSAEGSAP